MLVIKINNDIKFRKREYAVFGFNLFYRKADVFLESSSD